MDIISEKIVITSGDENKYICFDSWGELYYSLDHTKANVFESIDHAKRVMGWHKIEIYKIIKIQTAAILIE